MLFGCRCLIDVKKHFHVFFLIYVLYSIVLGAKIVGRRVVTIALCQTDLRSIVFKSTSFESRIVSNRTRVKQCLPCVSDFVCGACFRKTESRIKDFLLSLAISMSKSPLGLSD